jgi:hypothetical protein
LRKLANVANLEAVLQILIDNLLRFRKCATFVDKVLNEKFKRSFID